MAKSWRRQSKPPLDRHAALTVSLSHAARRVRPPSIALAKQNSVSVRTTKPFSPDSRSAENVRPRPGR